MRLDLRVVLGRGNSGKTYLVRHWLDAIGGRVLIFDPNAEDEYGQGAHVVDNLPDLVRILIGGFDPVRIAWRGLHQTAFEELNRAAWCAGDLTVVWEEVDAWWRPGQFPPFGFRMVNQGRHRGIRIIACSRRPATVARDITANASRIVAFHTTEPNDLKYLRDYMGDEAGRAAAQLDSTRYQAMDWTPAGGRVRASPFK